MCIIIIEDSQQITYEMIDNSRKNNPHGYGVLWYKDNYQNGENVVVQKGMWDAEKIWENAQKYHKLGYKGIHHFRDASPGFPVIEDNCHPFEYITSDDTYYFFHNGTLNPEVFENTQNDWTDSQLFFDQNIADIKDESQHQKVEKVIAPSRALVFSVKSNDYRLFNYHEEHEQCRSKEGKLCQDQFCWNQADGFIFSRRYDLMVDGGE